MTTMSTTIINHQMKKNIKSNLSLRKRKGHLKRKRRRNIKNKNKKLGIILMDLVEMIMTMKKEMNLRTMILEILRTLIILEMKIKKRNTKKMNTIVKGVQMMMVF